MIVKTDVKEVQVYRRSATITRGGEAILKQGRNIIFIAGMTASADQDTFRLKFPEGIRAINIQIAQGHEDYYKILPELRKTGDRQVLSGVRCGC